MQALQRNPSLRTWMLLALTSWHASSRVSLGMSAMVLPAVINGKRNRAVRCNALQCMARGRSRTLGQPQVDMRRGEGIYVKPDIVGERVFY
jgi:hypothetical protein